MLTDGRGGDALKFHIAGYAISCLYLRIGRPGDVVIIPKAVRILTGDFEISCRNARMPCGAIISIRPIAIRGGSSEPAHRCIAIVKRIHRAVPIGRK